MVDMDVSYSGLDANGARRGEQFDPAVLYRMVQEGATLAAIGAEIGYTREGVRLIIQRRGWTELRVENARKKRERERAETHRRRVLELLADGRGGKCDRAAMVARRQYAPLVRTVYNSCSRDQQATDAGCHLERLRAVAALGDGPVRRKAYDKVAREFGWPLSHAVVVAFGKWSTACEAAGVPYIVYKRVYKRRWSQDELYDHVCRYAMYAIKNVQVPSTDGYSKWALENGAASYPTLTKYRINWSDAVEEVKQQQREALLRRFWGSS